MVVRHENRFRNFLLDIQRRPNFELFILGAIIVNTFVLMAHWAGESPQVANAVELANYAFLALFTLEAVIKVVALGPIYFKERWNLFDFFVILLSYACIVAAKTT